MKRILLTLTAITLAILPARAAQIFIENFNYLDGAIIETGTNNPSGTTNWFRHGGAASPSDSKVANKKLQVSASSGAVSRQDDVNRPFDPVPVSPAVVYGSFTVNCTNLPTVSNYFAHFNFNNTGFHARVFQLPGLLSGTWRLGISGNSGTVNKIFPADLALNTDYQVVVQMDEISTLSATLWVNPIASTDPSVVSADAVTAQTIKGYGFRQASAAGVFFANITNLATATTFEEAATNVWTTNAVAPIVLRNPASVTNFVGDAVNLVGLASGQGLGSMTYLWLKNGAGVANANGNSNVFNIASAVVGDTGNYQMVATTPFGLSATSSPAAFLWVTNAPIPPTVIPSTNRSVAVFNHQGTSLQVIGSGPPTITYQWYYTNDVATGANVSGANTDTLTITDVTSTNGTAGAYKCVASNPYGSTTSGVFTVTAVNPPAVSIAFLRTLVDANNNATNLSTTGPRWQATGIITTLTNLTSGNTASYYLQDSTAAINLFVTGGSTFRPSQGDVVTVVGWLSSFNSTLELEADPNDPSTSYTVHSNSIALLPDQVAIPFNITNNLPFCETNLEGRIVMLTNVFFGTNAGLVISTTAAQNVTVTNAAGETFLVTFSAQDQDTAGQTLPSTAVTIVGPFTQDLGNTATPRNAGYRVTVTRFSDIVTNQIVVSDPHAGGASFAFNWTAAPVSYAYSVWGATSVTGPYTVLTNHLHLSDANGTFTNAITGGQKFYKVSTP
ncbi:MAG: hypothetical protein EXS35_07665 [Pedosphaera sp.]|nr:hypothetical protein [Pedosphaera sp.]